MNAVYRARTARSGGPLADAGAAVSAPGTRHVGTRHLPCTAVKRADGSCTGPAHDRVALHREDDHRR
ncbi:hypothetical protein [Streptomyces sp. NPDC059816]|uniref:hypothetical protein n=1 Tax=Streptomyces sp. NPDC059816 TaxID=3346960 RepID=UPI0036463113